MELVLRRLIPRRCNVFGVFSAEQAFKTPGVILLPPPLSRGLVSHHSRPLNTPCDITLLPGSPAILKRHLVSQKVNSLICIFYSLLKWCYNSDWQIYFENFLLKAPTVILLSSCLRMTPGLIYNACQLELAGIFMYENVNKLPNR